MLFLINKKKIGLKKKKIKKIKEQQPVSVWRHDTEYLDGKKPERAVDGLTERNNFNSFLSFRRYSQPYVHQQ